MIDKKELIYELKREFFFRYMDCPEGESPEDYPKRVLEGIGFKRAIDSIEEILEDKE